MKFIEYRYHLENDQHFSWSNWKLSISIIPVIIRQQQDAPKQQNTYDCGIFALKVSIIIANTLYLYMYIMTMSTDGTTCRT